jgi:hypothetical protein
MIWTFQTKFGAASRWMSIAQCETKSKLDDRAKEFSEGGVRVVLRKKNPERYVFNRHGVRRRVGVTQWKP